MCIDPDGTGICPGVVAPHRGPPLTRGGKRPLLPGFLPVDLPCSVRLPDLISREAVRPPLDTDEACRVIRCTDAFGILLIGLSSQAPPNDATVHRAFVEAKSRLEGAQSRSERGPYAVRHPRWQLARRRINGAWVALADPQTRLQIWSKWMLQRKGPTTSSVQCVVHAADLTAKSYILQDYEGASRRAKCEWARRWQAEVINLQHDGVRMRIPRDMSPIPPSRRT